MLPIVNDFDLFSGDFAFEECLNWLLQLQTLHMPLVACCRMHCIFVAVHFVLLVKQPAAVLSLSANPSDNLM